MGQTESNNIQMDFMYKKLENSLKIMYNYPDIYIKGHPETHWYIPYIGPETKSEKDVSSFIQFSKQVINDYPRSEIFRLGGGSLEKFKENENFTHPCTLMIWRDDVDDINEKASKIADLSEDNEFCIIF